MGFILQKPLFTCAVSQHYMCDYQAPLELLLAAEIRIHASINVPSYLMRCQNSLLATLHKLSQDHCRDKSHFCIVL